MRKVRSTVDAWLGWFLAGLMGLAVVNVLWQVFTRYVLSDPSSFTEELARYLLVWISVIGAAYAVGGRMHLAIDLLPKKLGSGRHGAILDLIINACVFAFALGVLVVGGLLIVRSNFVHGQTSPALGLKVAYVYCALPAAGLLMMFYTVVNTVDKFVSVGRTAERNCGT